MIPGIVIAGTHSGAGKTTVTLGIMALLAKKGYRVQGFKVGPDYIDPSFYKGITGRAGENLDSWMMSPEEVCRIYQEGCQGADLAVVEGVMGLFDGAKGNEDSGSTAEIAKILNLPVILVIDARSMARSVAPLIKGFVEFDPRIPFGGIIFNRVGSERHFQLLTEASKSVTDLKVVGCLPKDVILNLPERHLGLVPFYEKAEFQAKLAHFADVFTKTIDPELLLGIFSPGEVQSVDSRESFTKKPVVRIGVALDEAFGFYYQDNLRLLKRVGAEIITFSPLKESKLPLNLDGLYIGGGYPEVFAPELAANHMLLAEIRSLIRNGLPTYAECGGLMYLGKTIKTSEGIYPMLGILNIEVEMTSRREALGYIEVTALKDNLLLKEGQIARGHEFHYSKVVKSEEQPEAYLAKKADRSKPEGIVHGNLLASYIHLHFASHPGIAERFVEMCLRYRHEA